MKMGFACQPRAGSHSAVECHVGHHMYIWSIHTHRTHTTGVDGKNYHLCKLSYKSHLFHVQDVCEVLGLAWLRVCKSFLANTKLCIFYVSFFYFL